MNVLSLDKKTQVISSLVEGNSIRATCRMTGVAKGTVIRLLESVGKACGDYQDVMLRNLSCKQIECDEIWSFCYAKANHVPKEMRGKGGVGDVWTWVAIDADTKLVPSWRIGLRDAYDAHKFMRDLRVRVDSRVQISSDGYHLYLWAVEDAFGSDADYARIIKVYGKDEQKDKRYSPAECIATRKEVMQGNPDTSKVSTSYIERQNLTMRMNMRRFTRLTNAFSKKIENLEYAVALHFMYYNFCRPHKTLNSKRNLGITPAMASGVADRAWSIEDIIYLTNSN